VYYALTENAGKDPRENSALVADAIWAATDAACRTGATPPPPGVGYTLGGVLSGLGAGTAVALTLTVDGTTTAVTLNTNGGFTLPRRVSLGSTYLLAIATQPTGGSCAVANGSGTVAGTVGNLAISCGVLSSELQRLEIYNNSATAPIGYPRQFAVNGVAANGLRTDLTLTATWSSSNPNIATVNAGTGQVNGVAVGNVTISASYGGLSANVQIQVVSVPIVTTVAGARAGDADGVGRDARLSGPRGLAIDANGILYFADTGNSKIRRFDPITLMVSTVAGTGAPGYVDGPGASAQFWGPNQLAFDREGNLYVTESDGNRVRKISFSGTSVTVSTVAGNGTAGYKDSSAGASDSSGVLLNNPIGIVVDSEGTIFVADAYNTAIRKISRSGVTSTLAGSTLYGYTDGIGAQAAFNGPGALAIDSQNNLYVSDPSRLRKISPSGVVTTPIQNFWAQSMHISSNGVLYLGQGLNVSSANIADTSPTQSYVAGRGCCFADGPANEADFRYAIFGIVHDGRGSIYVADTDNSIIRKISPAP
jgi:streptogramin lyase